MKKNKTKASPSKIAISDLDPKQFVIIKGAKVHNLKNIDIAIPRNQLVVVTGVSGSGKSSLTIDTLYAEGQRRYVESLSSYARQFLMRMDKPDVEYIKGISPAIAIEQKVVTRSSRSTVGTLTEIYDYLRLLFARIGKTFSPISKKIVQKHQVSDVTNYLLTLDKGTKTHILIPFKIQSTPTIEKQFSLLLQKGFARVSINGELKRIEDLDFSDAIFKKKKTDIKVVIDRLVVRQDNEEFLNRAADSVQIAFGESSGDCLVEILDKEKGNQLKAFSNRFELDGMVFEEPSPHFFNFNNPYGACQTCEGFGKVIGIDENLVIPNKNLSVYEEAVACWRGEKMSWWKDQLIENSKEFDFPIHRPIDELTTEQYQLLWEGNEHFQGINGFVKHLESRGHKMHYRILLAKYRGRTECEDCKGTRLRKDTKYVKIGGKHIVELVLMPIKELHLFFKKIDTQLSDYQKEVAKRILVEINNRLQVMVEVGLGYLQLNRYSSTLSGGETQRINLTRSLGSNLTNSMYILDEPSIGLHPKDTERLIKVLRHLRNLGNTVIVVEHEEEIIRAADYLVDMGPLAGHLGGEVVFADTPDRLKTAKTLTADYLLGKKKIKLPTSRRKVVNKIMVKDVTLHNLKKISATFPLNAITVVSGVSGSGKTTLVKDILYPALKRQIDGVATADEATPLRGDFDRIVKIEMVDQKPLGRSSRSNPVTYIKAYDAIRKLFTAQQRAKIQGFKAKHFSFNVEGGRCETCKGEGTVTVEMQFLSDVQLICDECNGQRFKENVLEVTFDGKNISEVLNLSVTEALAFFKDVKDVHNKLKPLEDVGLGYVKLGQSSSTLSGGEAQRVKLASYLSKGSRQQPVLFVFDEPSTGLHFNDINKLLVSFNALVEKGHTIIIVEHNMDIIKCADWVIDLGPDGGDEGGHLLYEGAPEGLVKCKRSHTAKWLKGKV